MINDLTKTLCRVRELSPEAAALVDKNFSGYMAIAAEVDASTTLDKEQTDELIASLMAVVSYQAEIIEQLSDSLPKPSPDLLSETEAFAASLQGTYVSDLYIVYNRAFFRSYNKTTRLALCEALIKFANSKQKEPSTLWVSIVANNGALEN